VFGHGAELALGKALGGNVESAIEARTGVFPGDDRRELDQLAFGESMTKRGVELVRHVRGRASKRGGEAQDQFLLFVEVKAGFESRDVVELLFGDSGFSADGRMDVDSKRATDHQRGFELCQLLEVHGDGTFCGGVEVHANRAAQEFGIEGADACAERNAAQVAFQEEEDEPAGRASLIVLDAFRAKHSYTSNVRM
jgi:hypothetical protein